MKKTTYLLFVTTILFNSISSFAAPYFMRKKRLNVANAELKAYLLDSIWTSSEISDHLYEETKDVSSELSVGEIIICSRDKSFWKKAAKKVMIGELYGIETRILKRAVRRNIERFPSDFMIELTKPELENWVSQFGISNQQKMGLRIKPFAFTEQGVAMLSSVLRCKKAIEVNISIMRLFIKMRSFLVLENSLGDKVDELEKNTSKLFKVVFERLDEHEEIIYPSLPITRKKIGIHPNKLITNIK